MRRRPSRCFVAFSVFALALGTLTTGYSPATQRVALPTACGLQNLASPKPWHDSRATTYQAIVLARLRACHDKLLSPSPSPTDSAGWMHVQQCAPENIKRNAKKERGQDLAIIYYESLAVCQAYPSAAATPAPTPTALFKAQKPAVYVFMAGGTGSAGGISSGGTDNAGAFLLWVIANQIHNDFFPDENAIVIPEPTWSMTDFTNQCEADPYAAEPSPTPTDSAKISKSSPPAPGQQSTPTPALTYEGTLGAIALSGATITSGGDFWLLIQHGWAHASYTAAVFDCTDTEQSAPMLRSILTAQGQSYRNAVPLVPVALLGTYMTTWHNNYPSPPAAAAGGTPTPAPAATQNPLDTAAIVALAASLSQLGSYTIGNASPVVTVPRAYVDSARDLSQHFIEYCSRSNMMGRFDKVFCGKAPASPRTWTIGWPPGPCIQTRGASEPIFSRGCRKP